MRKNFGRNFVKTSNNSDRVDKVRIKKRHLALFSRLFVGRTDAYVRWDNDNFQAVKAPLSKLVLKAHLAGEYRVGSYLIRKDGCTSQIVFDVDEPKHSIVRKIVRRLQKLKITSYAERSKSKGFHIWIFLDRPTGSKQARQFAYYVLQGLDNYKIEVFPKQDKVRDGGFGNSIFLPLYGSDIPRDRTVFLDEKCDPIKKHWSAAKTIPSEHLNPATIVMLFAPSR
jgi:hypothetical protein